MIVKEDRKGWKNEVDELPAILLVNDEKVIVKVEGNVRSKQEILSPLCHAFTASIQTNDILPYTYIYPYEKPLTS